MATLRRFTAAICTILATVASSSQVEGKKYALDTLRGMDDGRLVSPHRAIVKLDCPECLPVNASGEEQSQALIFDFTINSPAAYRSSRSDNFDRAIYANNERLFPRIQEERHWRKLAQIVPAKMTIDEYMSDPSIYTGAYLLPNLTTRFLATTADTNLFYLMLEIDAYMGYEDKEHTTVGAQSTHLNSMSGIMLWVRRQNASSVDAALAPELCQHILRHDLSPEKELWTLEWLQIVDRPWLEWLRAVDSYSGPEWTNTGMSMPLGLEQKMTKEWDYYKYIMPTNQRRCLEVVKMDNIPKPKSLERLRIGPVNPFQIFTLMLFTMCIIIGPVWAFASLMRRLLNKLTKGWFDQVMGYQFAEEDPLMEWKEKEGRILLQ